MGVRALGVAGVRVGASTGRTSAGKAQERGRAVASSGGSECGKERTRGKSNAVESDCGAGERARASNMKIKRLTYTGACVFLNCHILNVAQSIKCLREKKPYQMSHLGKCGHLAERIAVTGHCLFWLTWLVDGDSEHQKEHRGPAKKYFLDEWFRGLDLAHVLRDATENQK